MSRTFRNAAGLIAIFVTTACGASSGASSSSPTPSPSPSPVHYAAADPCKLVTEADASTALGTAVTNVSAGGVAIPGECIYGATGTNVGMIVFTQIYPDQTTADAVQPDQMVGALGAQVSGVSNAQVVTDIGDKAVIYSAKTGDSNGIGIFVFKANVLIVIIMGPSQDENAIKTVARKAVDNLTSGS